MATTTEKQTVLVLQNIPEWETWTDLERHPEVFTAQFQSGLPGKVQLLAGSEVDL